MTEATRIQVAYDDRYLYIAILCEDGTPGGIAAGLGRRDELPSTDYVSIGFDPRHDHLTAYVFQTNPSAVQADFAFTDDDREDRDYNAVWEVRTADRRTRLDGRVPDSVLADAVRGRRPRRDRCGASRRNGWSGAKPNVAPGCRSRAASAARCRSSAIWSSMRR